jgi:hypothetical protein
MTSDTGGKFQGLVPQSRSDLDAIKSWPQIISVGEAAELAGVTPKTIREWAMRIDSLGVKRVGRWAIRRANLALLMSAGLERYRERLAIARARQAPPPSETHETSETHKSHHERLGEPRA